VRLSTRAQADLRDITRWLSQPGAGAIARKKRDAVRSGVKGLSAAPLRHPIFPATGGRKCTTLGGYEIHYDVAPDPPGSTTSGVVDVLFIRSPFQDYPTLANR